MKNSIYSLTSLVVILCCLLFSLHTTAQVRIGCGTPKPNRPGLTVPADYARPDNITGMRMIRLFIYNTRAEFTGAPLAQDEKEILAHLEFMRQQFAPYNICFIIQGFGEIIDDDIAFIDADDNAVPGLLQPYLKEGCLTIFIHNAIAGNVIGTSWDIPNSFVSLEGDYTWSGFDVLAGHEVAHALGLYHTFEDYFGKELVARSGACSNCSTAGDKICDTEADVNAPTGLFNTNCQYVGSLRDSCNNLYLMEPTNMMSYYSFTGCPVANHFTPGQGNRINFTIDNTPFLQDMLLTANSFTETTNQNYTVGRFEKVYRNNITINAASYEVSNIARLQMSSAEIVIKPGAHFHPGGGDGIVVLRANAMCQ